MSRRPTLSQRGQAVTEYALVIGALLAVVFVAPVAPIEGRWLTLFELFITSFDIYINSFHTVITLPIP